MRRNLAGALATVLVAGTAAVAATQIITGAAPAAAATDQYSWKNVQVVGGGFVDGIIFNQTQSNLVYARTDIGGVYRWNASGSSWTPLTDWVGWSNWNQLGAVSLATDPVATNRVYVAAGMYTNSWDSNNGAILRSTDQGGTWQSTALPFKLGGNNPGRGMGERLAIDPNKDSVLYLGAPSGNGLWRSTDYGVTWAKVTSFPNPGNYVQDPSDPNGYLTDNQGVVWVAFDKSTGSAGNTTQGIYVGVADLQNTVYRSTDGGTSWQRIAGQPTGFIAHKGVVDPVGGFLYLATSDKGGPYDGSHGDVWKYSTSLGTWTQISPIPSSDTSNNYFGYSGLSIDRQHPGTLMVTGYSSWWPDTMIWRSTDGGTTWTRAWDWTSYPSRSFRYTMDVSAAPWLTFGANPSPPEVTPKLGWMTEALEIDPFNSNRMMYGTGATLYGTTNLTNWDSGGQVTIQVMAKGLEETSVQDLISPPSGAPLVSALGDVGGFVHTNLDAVPSLMFTSPNLTTTTSLDYAELNPATIVRVGNIDKTASPSVNRIGFTTNSGSSWWQGSSEPSGVSGGGTVAEAADGSATVWSPDGTSPAYSTTYGSSWTTSTGLPTGARVGSDRVDPKKFYAYSGGTFFLSTNGGASFASTGATGLPTSNVKFKAVPGHTGDIWLAGGTGSNYGLWHSTDSGTSFTKQSNVDQADTIGFGKAAPGQSYLALYTSAQIGGVRGIFRSDDAGATWVRINDDQHQWGMTNQAITGDPRVYGRVYIATNGRGIIYGDRTGTSTATPTSSTPPTTASPTPTGSVTPTATATAQPTGGCTVTYTVTNQWQGGFGANVTIANNGTSAVNGWTLKWSFANGQVISTMWNASYTQSGAAVSATNASYNGTIAAGGTSSFGFNASWNNTTNAKPASFTLNGATCAAG